MAAVTGQVAKILDEKRLIINRGSEHGVTSGQRFVVFAEVEDVTDPASGEPLGRWEMLKGSIHAEHVQEKLTVCAAGWPEKADEADEKKPSTHTLSGELVEVSFSLKDGSPRAGAAKLNVDRAAISGVPKVGPITVGDKVRSVE